MKLNPEMKYSELREMAADLPDEGIRGMIRLLRLILHDRDGKEECPICTWDMEGQNKALWAKKFPHEADPTTK